MVGVVIVDDEAKGRSTLESYIREYCPNARVLGTAASAAEGHKIILQHKPDLVLLDVEMPGGTGFDMLELFETIDFAVVFTTAFGHYAIRAIKHSALDYLLKPIDIEDLEAVVNKVEQQQNNSDLQVNIETLLSNIRHTDAGAQKLVLTDTTGLLVIQVGDIIRLESESSYTRIFMQDGQRHLQSKNLGDFEKALEDHPKFMRVHRSHIINLEFVTRYVKGEGGVAVMIDGSEVEISRRRRSEFIALLGTSIG